MSLKDLDDEVIDKLYKKYNILDDEGYLVGTNDKAFLKLQKRIEYLSKKIKLTKEEEREAAELVIVNKSYMKELKNYVLDVGLNNGDAFEDEDEDDDDEDYGSEEDDEDEDEDYDSEEETE